MEAIAWAAIGVLAFLLVVFLYMMGFHLGGEQGYERARVDLRKKIWTFAQTEDAIIREAVLAFLEEEGRGVWDAVEVQILNHPAEV